MVKKCEECEGTGLVDCPYCGAEENYECDECGGTGEIDEDDEEIDE